MKKNIFFVALAAIATIMASCSNEDVLIDQETANNVEIGFSSNDVDNATRANIDMTWMQTADATNAKFGVFGYKGTPGAEGTVKIFDNESVFFGKTSSMAANDWYHSTIRFWDKNAADAYNFYAYAPYAANASENNGVITFSTLPIFQIITASGVDDICLATPVNGTDFAACSDSHVSFTFNHVLSKLAFQYKTTITSDVATITVTKVEIQTPTGKNDASWAQDSKTVVTGKSTFGTYTQAASSDFFDQNVPTAGTNLTSTPNVLGDSYVVVPCNDTYKSHAINIKVTYDITYNDGKKETGCIATGAIKANNADIAFASNTFYTVTVTVNPATIEFDVDAVNGWTDNKDGAVEVN